MNEPTKKILKKSGILFSIIILLIFTFIPFFLKGILNLFPLILAFAILLISFIRPYFLRIPYLFWIKLGDFLSKLNSNLILIIFFYLIITPFALLRRLLRIKKKKKDSKISYYKILKSNTPQDFDGQY